MARTCAVQLRWHHAVARWRDSGTIQRLGHSADAENGGAVEGQPGVGGAGLCRLSRSANTMICPASTGPHPAPILMHNNSYEYVSNVA
jgi:hypothetical protein